MTLLAVNHQNIKTVMSETTVRYNAEKNGVEVKFDAKPAEDVRAQLKRFGFRWSRFSQVWYKKLAESSWHAAHRIAGIANVPPMPTLTQTTGTATEDNTDPAAGLVAAQEEAFERNQLDMIGR